jgi:uncharacterized membrane protein (DUF106 family)
MDAIITGLNILFSPVLGFPPLVAEAIVVGIIMFFVTLLSKYLVNQEYVKKLNEERKALQEKMKNSNSQEDVSKYTKELFAYNMKIMNANKWAMLASLLIFVLIFGWMAETFLGKVLITIPVVNITFGWLMYYIILSLIYSAIFKKILKVV